MKRRPRAAHRPGYPTLAGLLAGAALAPGLALADVSPPPPVAPGKPPRPPVATRGQQPPQATPPAQTPGKPPRRDPPKLMGKLIAPRTLENMPPPKPPQPPPEPPARRAVPAAKPKVDFTVDGGLARARPPSPVFSVASAASAGKGLVIHPHGPGEPCSPIDDDGEPA